MHSGTSDSKISLKRISGAKNKGPRSSPRAAKRWEGTQRRGTRIAWAHDVGGILPPSISLGALVLTHPKNHRKSVHWSSQRYFRSTIFILWTYLYILLPWIANRHSPPAIYGSRTEHWYSFFLVGKASLFVALLPIEWWTPWFYINSWFKHVQISRVWSIKPPSRNQTWQSKILSIDKCDLSHSWMMLDVSSPSHIEGSWDKGTPKSAIFIGSIISHPAVVVYTPYYNPIYGNLMKPPYGSR